MSGLFGGGGSQQSNTPKQLNSIQTMQSSYGNCLPLVYGRTRIPATIIWYTNFTATPSSSDGGGGKGGGGVSASTTYTYSASVILALCEGQINSVNNTFADKEVHGPGYAGGPNPWVGTGDPLTDLGFTFFNGAVGQPLWTYPAGTPAAQQLNYSSTAYLTCSNFQLGSSAAMPNMTFEVIGINGTLSAPYINTAGDVDPASNAYDYCNDPTHGCGFGAYYNQVRNNSIASTFTASISSGTRILTISAGNYTPQTLPVGAPITNVTAFPSGATITGWDTTGTIATTNVVASANVSSGTFQFAPSTWQMYCVAYGFYSSPAETTQRAAQDFLTEMLTLTNSDSIWTNGQQVIIPLDDSTVSNGTYTHIPNNGAGGSFTTPLYNFTDDDYASQEGGGGEADPVIVIRKGVSATYNKVNVEFLDRSNQYNTSIAQAFDANDIAINGERVMDTLSLHQICDNTVARLVAQLVLQRQLYYKNSYRFQVRADYCLLEPMDVIGVTDSGLGISNALCRIDTIDEDADGTLTIECTELPFGPGVTPQYNYQAGSRGWYLANVAPGVVRAPYFIPVPKGLHLGSTGYELYIAVNGVSTSSVWGGCRVWMSYDNSNYVDVGTITGGARYGTLTAVYAAGPAGGLDTTNYLELTLNESTQTMVAGSQQDADNARTLLWVDGEWIAYQYCTLVSTGVYGMTSTGLSGGTKYNQRALYGSSDTTHALGASWARIDGSIFRIALGAGVEGQTVYFKFQSFNIYGKAMNSLASETAYTYVVGSNYAGLGAQQTNWKFSGTANFAGQNIYKPQTGANAWDSTVWSSMPFTGGAVMTWQAIEATTAFMGGLGATPTVNTSYTAVDYAIYLNAGTIAIYEGQAGTTVQQHKYGAITSFGTYVAGDNFSVQYDGRFVKYYHNGQLLRAAQPLKQNLALYGMAALYSATSPVGATLTNVAFTSLKQDGSLVSNLLSTQSWKVGTTGLQGNYDDYIGSGTASSIVLGTGPYGSTEPLWQVNGCGPGLTAWNGGFYNSPVPFASAPGFDLAGLDPSKTYRFSVWFRYTSGTPGGGVYLGCDLNGATLDLATSASDSNPYFCYISPASGLTSGKWYLMVGLLHGSGFAGTTTTGVSAIYDPGTGLPIPSGVTAQEYKQSSGGNFANQTIRAGMYNNVAAGIVAQFSRPRVEEVNGLEPSINLMLNTASTANIGANAATSVVNASYSAAQNIYSASSTYSISTGIAVDLLNVAVGPFPYDTTIVVTVTGNVDHYFPASQATSYCGPVATNSPLTVTPAYVTGYAIARNASTASPEVQSAFAAEILYSLPASATQSFYAMGTTGLNGTTVTGAYCNISALNLKAEVIKR